MLAGAGTGKTAALTARLAHLVASRRAWPSEILCVTFTNKAAREMRERVGGLIGPAVEGMPWLGTFHAIAARMLRRHAELVGLQSNYTIIDTDDQIRLLKQLIRGERPGRKALARPAAGRADRPLEEPRPASRRPGCGGERGLCQWPGRAVLPALPGPAEGAERLRFRRSAAAHAQHPEAHGDVLERISAALQIYHGGRIPGHQHRPVPVAAPAGRSEGRAGHNICVVGDDDQSIYSWRGAEVANILRFEKDFPGAKVIRLEQNYRSTPQILAAASA